MMPEPKELRPYEEMVEMLFKDMGCDASNLMHAVVGVVGEVIELNEAIENRDLDNCLEEMGDLCFYIQKLLTMYGYTWDRYSVKNYQYLNLLQHSGNLLDLAKKHWAYNKKLDEDKFAEELDKVAIVFLQIADDFGWSLEDIQIYNQIKLAKRYPQGVYSDQDAQTRADKI